MDGVGDERHAFLLVQPADVADDGLEHILQPEPLPQGLLVLVLVVERVDAVLARDVAVHLRVPDLVINAVEDAAHLAAMHLQGMAQAEVLGRVQDLPGVTGRDRGDEVGIDNAALHQVEGGVVEIVLEAVLVKEVGVPVQPGGAQDVLPGDALVLEVVQRVAHPRMGHAHVLVHLVEQHRHQAGLPVVAVNDVRVLVALEHELQRGPAEEGEPLVVIHLPVEGAAVEEVVVGMRLDEEALAAVHEAEIDAAMHGVVVPRHPQVFERELQVEDLVIPQAVVLGQDDLHRVAANLQLPAQPEHDVAQPPHLGHGGALGCNLNDIHNAVTPLHRYRGYLSYMSVPRRRPCNDVTQVTHVTHWVTPCAAGSWPYPAGNTPVPGHQTSDTPSGCPSRSCNWFRPASR